MKTKGLFLVSLLVVGCMSNDDDSSRAVEWSEPVSVSTTAAAFVEVAQLRGGTTLVLRRSVEGTEDVVTVTSHSSGSAPRSVELLRVRDLNCCASPWGGMRVKSDGRGGALLVWMERLASPPYRKLHGRYYSEATGLGPQWSVVGVQGNAIRAFDLSVREDGIGHLGWIESTPDAPVTEELGPSLAFAAEITSTGPTASREVLSSTIPIDQSGFFNVTTAVSSSGYRMVLWTRQSFVATISELWATVAAPGGAWQPARRISEGPQGGGPSVGAVAGAIGNAGTGVVAWEMAGSSPDIQRIDFATVLEGNRWSDRQVLAQPASRPDAGVAETSDAYVAFLDRTQSALVQNSIKLARIRGDRLASIEEVTPSQTQSYTVGRPSLAVMRGSNVLLAWTATARADPLLPRVERRVLAESLNWQDTEQVSRPGSAASTLEPFTLVGDSSNIALFWQQDAQLWFQVARPLE